MTDSAPSQLRFLRVEFDWKDARLQRLDRILARERVHLSPPGARLEPMAERVLDPDDGRVLIAARLPGRWVGVLDAIRGWPSPDVVTVSQVAVHPSHRNRGLGRGLVQALVRELATRDDGAPPWVEAHVLDAVGSAAAFWERLGGVELAPGHFRIPAEPLGGVDAPGDIGEASPVDGIEIRRARADELPACIELRRQVFVEEQSVPLELEVDGLDPQCRHVLALDDRGEPVGTARLRATAPGVFKVERVCVVSEMRSRGIGDRIMGAVEEWARELEAVELRLSAQLPALRFYERLGWTSEGEVFEEAGIPHLFMKKRVTLP